jgi:DNA-binding IclR family transcriptional regulator
MLDKVGYDWTMSTNGMLAKGLTLFVALAEYPAGVGVTKLARDVRLPVSTVHRLLAEMVRFGFVHLDAESRRYYLGVKFFELSHRVSRIRSLSELALPAMRELADATGETIFMAMREGNDLFYVERVEGRRRIQVQGFAGERGPLHATAGGKCLLAFLPEEEQETIISELELEKLGPNTITALDELRRELELTQDRGYAVNDEENQEAIRAVGVPIIGARGRPAAAISVAGPAFLISLEILEQFVPLLHEKAREIGLQLPPINTLLTTA